MSSSTPLAWHDHLSTPASPEVSAALIAHQSQQDPELAKNLRENPKVTLEKLAQDRKLPESLRIEVHDNSDDTWHLPLPREDQNQTLDSEQLDKLAAGELVSLTISSLVLAGVVLTAGVIAGAGYGISKALGDA